MLASLVENGTVKANRRKQQQNTRSYDSTTAIIIEIKMNVCVEATMHSTVQFNVNIDVQRNANDRSQNEAGIRTKTMLDDARSRTVDVNDYKRTHERRHNENDSERQRHESMKRATELCTLTMVDSNDGSQQSNSVGSSWYSINLERQRWKRERVNDIITGHCHSYADVR